MKCSLRFEKLMAERKCSEDAKSMTDEELLAELVAKYNSYKANAALTRWQVSPDQHSAMLAVICGMTSESRQLVRTHLDFNKWEESGLLMYYSRKFFPDVCFSTDGVFYEIRGPWGHQEFLLIPALQNLFFLRIQRGASSEQTSSAE